ncbi:MAG: hypothetical protein DWQ19_13020 [Crenarchaeota archaeon]|nr:MAG: hypothetical protein DWQ19_13020 [Thermoproteota archaeon]
MKYKVHLFGCSTGITRYVDVPDEDVPHLSQDELLDRIFCNGQNEHQPQRLPGVSYGDVIELHSINPQPLETSSYFFVTKNDFWALTPEQFERYSNLPLGFRKSLLNKDEILAFFNKQPLLEQMLADVVVDPPDLVPNDLGWYGVSTGNEGTIAYFKKESDAFRFRLDLINLKLNPLK